MQNDNLKLIFFSIVRGFSEFYWEKNHFFIKHLNFLDSAAIESKKQNYLDNLKSRGIVSYQEKLDYLISKNFWSKEKDNKIEEIKSFLVNLHHTKKKYAAKKDKLLVQKDIDNYSGQLFDLTLEKNKLMGITAENQAEKKSNEFYIFDSLYKSTDLKEKFYTEKEFDELEEKDILELTKLYNDKMSIFSDINLKKISLMPNFFNIFVLSNDNFVNLFGRPLIEMTFYQIEIIQNARNYHNLLKNSEMQPPPEVLSDYEKLVDWFEVKDNKDKLIKENLQDTDQNIEIGGGSVVGMDKKEMEEVGMDLTLNKKLNEELAKKGQLDYNDFIKLHGI